MDKVKENLLRIFLIFRGTNTTLDRVHKEFVIRKTISINPLDEKLKDKFGDEIHKYLESLRLLDFITVTTHLDGKKIGKITKLGKKIFYLTY